MQVRASKLFHQQFNSCFFLVERNTLQPPFLLPDVFTECCKSAWKGQVRACQLLKEKVLVPGVGKIGEFKHRCLEVVPSGQVGGMPRIGQVRHIGQGSTLIRGPLSLVAPEILSTSAQCVRVPGLLLPPVEKCLDRAHVPFDRTDQVSSQQLEKERLKANR